ncbi:galactosyldiacylglycerol synthase [Lederbergia sp. NSJ-179]|uniref:MGDG synthase family glycosyltransferase n=1 Tax=Lederbergia sp. NSJ-179 TaxID=2931402 RepID=UPI001FD06E71|nr:galactosyldiacylglycerol synthase [Lederbergia sp. NSJ-179]MCJ7840078.1 galactosyldiacylglycerol synthase [Lederbergia sp. NSJ-179]
MKKILFFPLLTMPSGHHQVADTIESYLKKRNRDVCCRKIDLLSAWNPVFESMITKTYLGWIHYFPKTYAWTYKKMAHNSGETHDFKKYYDLLFLKKMKAIILEEKPDLVICTHAFPSHFLSKLKKQYQLPVPILNVYTDFFINDVWGIEGIDYHFVASQEMKRSLVTRKHVPEERIWVTGIPIGEQFWERRNRTIVRKEKWRILVSGGSVGLGGILDFLKSNCIMEEVGIDYFVLCGKNEKLYQQLEKDASKHIHPLPYISDKEEMNTLYESVDAIITKPGGVTISESLKKGLPIFIHSALPGQEEINLQFLKEQKLVVELNPKQSLESSILSFFQDSYLMDQFQHSLELYLNQIEAGSPANIDHLLDSILQKSYMENTVKLSKNPG